MPSPKQSEGHAAAERYVLLGGAAGPGKTRWLIEHAVRFARRWPQVRVGIFRRTYPELQDTIIDEFIKLVPETWAVYNGQARQAKFANGSFIDFRHCLHDEDVYKRQGVQYQLICFDELTHFSERVFDYLGTRLRSLRAGVPMQVLAATNPGGRGHAWVKRRWVDADPPTRPDWYRFIPATLEDHPDAGFRARYREQLESHPDPVLQRALLYGDWDAFAGQFFAAWRPDRHIIEPYQPPADWHRWRAVDYGSTAPFCCLWAAQDPATLQVVVYREYYAAGRLLADNAAEVARLSAGERYRASVGDPSMWARGPTAAGSLADQAAAAGLVLSPAYNDRLAGWQIVKRQLADQAARAPGLLVMRTCANLVRTLPAQVYDARMVEDLDSGGEDHAVDALRYLLAEVSGRRRLSGPVRGASTRDVVARSAYA